MKTKKILKIFLPLILVFVLLFNLTACSEDRFMKDSELMKGADKIYGTITLRVNAYGEYWQTFDLPFELYYKKAPITVTNFCYLIQSGFYDYTKFEENYNIDNEKDKVKPIMHRLEKSSDFFILQGGGYKVSSEDIARKEIVELRTGGLNYTIKGEFADNGWTKNDLSHTVGTLSMARQSEYDTASSEFFMTLGDCSTACDDKYAAFGKITSLDGKLLSLLKDMAISSEKFSFSSSYFNNYPKYKIEIYKLSLDAGTPTFSQSLQISK